MKVTRIQNVVPITDKKRKKQTKEDFKRLMNRPPPNDAG